MPADTAPAGADPPGGGAVTSPVQSAGGRGLLALGAALVLLVPTYLLTLAGGARPVVAVVSAAGGVVVLALAAMRRHRADSPGRCELVAAIGFGVTVAALADARTSQSSLGLMAALVVLGGLGRSAAFVGRWTVLGAGAGAVVAVTRLPPGPGLRVAVALAVVGGLGLALHRVRGVAEGRLRDQVDSLARSAAALADSELRYRNLFDHSPLGVGMADHRGVFVAVNEAMGAIVGRDPAEIVGRTSEVYTHPDDRHLVARGRLVDGAPVLRRLRKRIVRPDGQQRWIDVTATTMVGADGLAWTVGHMWDVTHEVEAASTLAKAQQDVATIADVVRRMHSGDDVRSAIVTAAQGVAGAHSAALIERDDADHLVFSAQAGAPRVAGMSVPARTATAAGHVWSTGRPLFVADPVGHPLVSPELLDVVGGRSLMWQPVSVAGTVLAVLVVAWPHRVADLDDRAARSVQVLADEAAHALERESMIRSLESMAATDPLTGLANRRAWDEGLAAAMAGARRTGSPLTVALVDVDHFKAFNDQHGHGAGDAILRAFAAVAGATVRGADVLARWGGEEFALMLVDCSSGADALAAVDRVRTSMPGPTTCSAGVATWDGEETAQQLVMRADSALYAAKSEGRDRTVAGPPSGASVPAQRWLTGSDDAPAAPASSTR